MNEALFNPEDLVGVILEIKSKLIKQIDIFMVIKFKGKEISPDHLYCYETYNITKNEITYLRYLRFELKALLQEENAEFAFSTTRIISESIRI